jgi:hypothetical protein
MSLPEGGFASRHFSASEAKGNRRGKPHPAPDFAPANLFLNSNDVAVRASPVALQASANISNEIMGP